jgi:hypothetical protein
MNEPGQIYTLMGKILKELPAIGKTQENTQQGFMYRGHDDVLNALNPLLAKHGVFIGVSVLERLTDKRQTRSGGIMFEVNLHVLYTFYAPDGSQVTAEAWGEGTDSGDKATNKAMTGAFKNVLAQVFAISTAETRAMDIDSGNAEEAVAQQVHDGGDNRRAPTDEEVQAMNEIINELLAAEFITTEQIKNASRLDVPLGQLADHMDAEQVVDLTRRLREFKDKKGAEGAEVAAA